MGGREGESEGGKGKGGVEGGRKGGIREGGREEDPTTHMPLHLLRATSARTGHPHLARPICPRRATALQGELFPPHSLPFLFFPSHNSLSDCLSSQQMTVGFLLCAVSPDRGDDPEEDRQVPEILELSGPASHRMGTMRVFSGGERRARCSRGLWSELIPHLVHGLL